ncbi:hypothetical protein CEXT_443951, partial [Caerostris extrusa]
FSLIFDLPYGYNMLGTADSQCHYTVYNDIKTFPDTLIETWYFIDVLLSSIRSSGLTIAISQASDLTKFRGESQTD